MGRKAAPREWRSWYITDAGGKRHKLCLVEQGLRKAKEVLKDYLGKLAEERYEAEKAGLVKMSGRYTCAHLAAEFLEFQEGVAKSDHFQHNRRYLRRFVDWYGNLEARRLQLSHFGDYLKRLRQLPGRGGRLFSGTSINHHIRVVKAALLHAVDQGRLVKNPWGRKAKKVLEHVRKRVVTDGEFQALLYACEKCIAYRGKISRADGVQLMRDILYVLRYTGLRPGEVRKLRGDHVHLDQQLIVIPTEEHKTGETAKEPKPRMSPILPEVQLILATRKQKYGDGLLFPNTVGTGFRNTDFSRRFARLCRHAKIKPDRNGEILVAHSLRHTRLTEAGIKEKLGVFTLMHLAGHSSAETTKRYVHSDAESLVQNVLEARRNTALPAHPAPPGPGRT